MALKLIWPAAWALEWSEGCWSQIAQLEPYERALRCTAPTGSGVHTNARLAVEAWLNGQETVLGAPCFQRLEPLGHGLGWEGEPAFSQFVGDADLTKRRLFKDSTWPSFFVLDRCSHSHEMVPS
jgi:hypothetical protein